MKHWPKRLLLHRFAGQAYFAAGVDSEDGPDGALSGKSMEVLLMFACTSLQLLVAL